MLIKNKWVVLFILPLFFVALLMSPSVADAKKMGKSTFLSMAEAENGNVVLIYGNKGDIAYRVWDKADGWQDKEVIMETDYSNDDFKNFNVYDYTAEPFELDNGVLVWYFRGLTEDDDYEYKLFYYDEDGAGTVDLDRYQKNLYKSGNKLIMLYNRSPKDDVYDSYLRTWSKGGGLSDEHEITDDAYLGNDINEGDLDANVAVNDDGLIAISTYNGIADWQTNIWDTSDDFSDVGWENGIDGDVYFDFDAQGNLLAYDDSTGLNAYVPGTGWTDTENIDDLTYETAFEGDDYNQLLFSGDKSQTVYKFTADGEWETTWEGDYKKTVTTVVPETNDHPDNHYFGRWMNTSDRMFVYKWTADDGWVKVPSKALKAKKGVDIHLNVSSKGKLFLTWYKNKDKKYYARVYNKNWKAKKEFTLTRSDSAATYRHITPKGNFVTIWKEQDGSRISARWIPNTGWKKNKTVTAHTKKGSYMPFKNMVSMIAVDGDDNGYKYDVKQSKVTETQVSTVLEYFEDYVTTDDNLFFAYKDINGKLKVRKY